MKSISWLAIAIFCLPGVVHAQKGDEPKPRREAPWLITKETQKGIDAGLKYLAKEQAKDGSWGKGNWNKSVGITSLAALAFLSGGHHPDQGEHGKAVTKALRFVLSQEDPKNPGFFKENNHGPMYAHGFAMLFFADAHGSITDKELKAEVHAALARGVKVILDSQKGNRWGGWRYVPWANDADLSVTACQACALRAARDVGIGVPRETLDKAAAYLIDCQHRDNGGFCYQSGPGGAPSVARTAVGLAALNRLGETSGKSVDRGLNYLAKADRKKEAANVHYIYGAHYETKLMWYRGGKDWQKWFSTIRDEFMESQKEDGRWGQAFNHDPHLVTALVLIMLQVPHEHLPSLRR